MTVINSVSPKKIDFWPVARGSLPAVASCEGWVPAEPRLTRRVRPTQSQKATGRRYKAVIFDLNAVLIDAKEWLYEALNRALALFCYGGWREPSARLAAFPSATAFPSLVASQDG